MTWIEKQDTQHAQQKAERDALQAAYDAEIAVRWKAANPRRKYKPGCELKLPDHEAWRAPWGEKAKALGEAHVAQRKELEAAWQQAARAAVLTPLPTLPAAEWPRIGTVYGGSYSTQGPGRAEAYARASAQRYVDLATFYGIPARMEQPSGGGSWDVFAACSPEDAEFLLRKPGPSLAEEVRRQWARGINPRVFNPFLPHGFEERVGIDYFGRVADRAKFEAAGGPPLT